MSDRMIGQRVLVDTVTRPVYEDANGKQYVLDDGERIDGLILLLQEPEADMPFVVEQASMSQPHQC